MRRSDPRLDPRYLPTFLAVCEAGGVRAAASAVHRTQPAITYQLRRLEEQLGAALFERVGRRLVLTAEGRALRGFAERMLDEFAVVSTQIARREPTRHDRLRIAAVSGFGRYVLFPTLLTVLESAAGRGAQVNLALRTADEILAQVQAGACDLGVVYRPSVSSQLRLEPIYREELALVLPRRRPRSWRLPSPGEPAGTWSDLPFVTYDEGDYVFGMWFQAVCGQPPGVTASVHHCEELEEVLGFVAAGAGGSIVPLDSALPLLEAGGIRVRRPGGRRCYNDVFAVTRAGAAPRPEIAALITAIRALPDGCRPAVPVRNKPPADYAVVAARRPLRASR